MALCNFSFFSWALPFLVINSYLSKKKNEPFVLAMQAQQVYYCTYLSLQRDTRSWWAVCKIKARGMIEMPAKPEITP